MAEITKEQVKEFLSGLSVLEISELTKELEEDWGVTAAAPVAMAGMAAMPAAGAEEEKEEQTEFNVVLKEVPSDKRVSVIKELRNVVGNLGLKEAKELVEAAPTAVKEAVAKDEAEDAKKKLEAAGAVIEIS
ncbi:MAG: 50S ribosomal protein L7/L12 [Deltaproteobacteria bacterium]|nr:50S ribosomal protein L7/L12 [Deltaproteobacteria bacterium]